MKTALTALSALILTSAALASEPGGVKTSPEYAGWEFGLTLGQTQIDSNAAGKADIGDTADTFTLYAEYYFANSPWVVNGGLGYLGYDDKAGYSQMVQEQYSGKTYTKNSYKAAWA